MDPWQICNYNYINKILEWKLEVILFNRFVWQLKKNETQQNPLVCLNWLCHLKPG